MNFEQKLAYELGLRDLEIIKLTNEIERLQKELDEKNNGNNELENEEQ